MSVVNFLFAPIQDPQQQEQRYEAALALAKKSSEDGGNATQSVRLQRGAAGRVGTGGQSVARWPTRPDRVKVIYVSMANCLFWLAGSVVFSLCEFGELI